MNHVIIGCLLLALTGTSAVGQEMPKGKSAAARNPKPTSELASTVDPVCGMSVAKTVADTAHYAGKHYGFCSKVCRERFKRQPTAYVNTQGKPIR